MERLENGIDTRHSRRKFLCFFLHFPHLDYVPLFPFNFLSFLPSTTLKPYLVAGKSGRRDKGELVNVF